MPAVLAVDKLEDILANSENFLHRMHELGQEPHQQKQLNRLFSPSEAASMVGRDRTTLARAEAEIRSVEYFLVVLDEVTYPLRYGWIPLEPVLSCLRERPENVHVVLTGRNAPEELVELADTVTEMRRVKHH